MLVKSVNRSAAVVSAVRSDQVARVFVWSSWLVMLFIALLFLARQDHNIPLTEDWTLVPALTGNEPNLAKWLWSQNNEHRVPLPRVLLLLLLNATNGDFRIGMFFNIITLAVLALAMIQVARQIRGGRTTFADAFFPVALLHLGNWENLYWSWQLSFVVSVLLVCAILLALTGRYALETPGAAAVTGACLVLLPLCGGTGLLFVPPLALWIGYCGLLHWFKGEVGQRWTGAFLISAAVLTCCLTGFYFVGYERPLWTPPNPGLWPSLKAALQFLALGLGPAARGVWMLSITASVSILAPSMALTVVGVLRHRGPERYRALGILAFFCSMALFTLAMGWGRAGVIAIYGSWPIRYVLLAVPAFCIAFFVWELYGPVKLRTLVQVGLLIGMGLLIPANSVHGFWWGDWYQQGADTLEKDLAAGATPYMLAERNREFLFHSIEPSELANYMQMLKKAGIGPFTQLQDDSLHAVLDETTTQLLVSQEILYSVPEATEVFLIWGVDGWQVVPEHLRPANTTVTERGVMQTQMDQKGNVFVVEMQVPINAVIDHGFLVTAQRDDSTRETMWDGDYQTLATEDKVTEIETSISLTKGQSETDTIDVQLITQEIQYHASEASQVFLVWGINGWESLPEEARSDGTIMKHDVMYTRMIKQGDGFIATIHVPASSIVDYAFQITRTRGGDTVDIWDTNEGKDYHTQATPDSAIVQVKTKLLLSTERLPINMDNMGFLWLIGLGFVASLGAFTAIREIDLINSTVFGHKERLIYLRDLLYELVIRDIKLRYKGSILGVAWSLLNPLAQLLVFSFIFQYILPLDIENYTAFLFSGLVMWNWFQSSLFASATVVVEGRSLIKRPGFPTAILPVVTVTSNLVHFLLALPILFFFLLLTGMSLQPALVFLPLVIALQFVFTLSVSYILAAAHVTFRDTQHLIGVFLLLLFYLSPIFYDASVAPGQVHTLYRLNPIAVLLDGYRAVLLQGQMPDLLSMLTLAVISLGLLVWGYRIFMHASYTFVEEL